MAAERSKRTEEEFPPEIEQERERFRAFLRARRLSLTSQRQAVFEEVFRHHGHLYADEIAERLRKSGRRASRATVYRTLDLLVDAGLVKRVRLGSLQRQYEHVHFGEHHDHLVCEKCGRIIEFFSPEIEDCQTRVCEENDFEPVRHTMIIFGLCSRCRKGRKR